MAPQPGFGITVWLALVPLVLGLGLLWFGLRPRRRGTTPHCRQCNYNLTGLESERCPECGTHLTPEAIVHGELRRRPGRIVAGCLLLALSAAVVGLTLTRVNWYRLVPTFWVMRDLQSPDPPTERKAWRELQRRAKADQLSAAQHSSLIDICLAHQAGQAPMLPNEMNYVGQAYRDGRLSQAQAATFFQQIPNLELRVRPRGIAGDPIPFELRHRSRMPSAPFWCRAEREALTVDGEDTERRLTGWSQFSGGGGGSSGSTVRVESPGRHKLGVSVTVRTYHGPFGKPEASVLCHEQTYTLEAAFTVLDEEPPDYIRTTDDPDLIDKLKECIVPDGFSLKRERPRPLEGTIKIEAPPVNIAFDVLVRINDKEHDLGAVQINGSERKLGTVRKARGESTHWNVGCDYDGPALDSCDVILRSSKEVARRSIDLFEIWEGELVYEDVPVEVREQGTGKGERSGD